MLQACLNGALTKDEYPHIPISASELADAAAKCVVEGADSIHLHPRDGDGQERLDPDVVDAVVEHVRAKCGVPVCVSTGAWIEPDAQRRVSRIRGWTQPDLATVNVSEDGAADVMGALLEIGIGVEAGIWSVEDVERLASLGLAEDVTRVLVEPVEVPPHEAETVVADIHLALDYHAVGPPRLQHGDGEATWILVADAFRRGIDTRIGFEDTLSLPDGQLAVSNAELVRAACGIRGRIQRVEH